MGQTIKWIWGLLLVVLYLPLLFLVYLACWGTTDMMFGVLRGVQAVSGREQGAIVDEDGQRR